MAGTPNKRQKREAYQRSIAEQTKTNASNASNLSQASMGQGPNEPKTFTAEVKATKGEIEGHGKGKKKGSSKGSLVEGGLGGGMEMPKKKFYRQRAHANVFSDHNLVYPISPEHVDWSTHFPAFISPDPASLSTSTPSSTPRMSKPVEVADIGCGFGGLLVALSPVLPETLMIGMELRAQVLTYVTSRIQALRSQSAVSTSSSTPSSAPTPHLVSASSPPGAYQNISALRTNTMKHLPNFFSRAQLSHLFLCFPDPHFKARKHKARIVSSQLNAEYAFVVRPGGRVYVITDVEELFRWVERRFDGEREEGEDRGPRGKGVEELWERIGEGELEKDPCVGIMKEETEEGKKVTRNGGRKFVGVWQRKECPEWPT